MASPVCMSGSTVCSRNLLYLELSIKGFLPPGQQTHVMNQSLGGTLTSAMSGGGGEVWECHLGKGCGWALGTFPDAYRLHTHMGSVSLSPCGWWLPWRTARGCWKPWCWTKGKEDQICWKHHRLLTLPWWNSPRKCGRRFDGAFPSHHPPQWVSFCQQACVAFLLWYMCLLQG